MRPRAAAITVAGIMVLLAPLTTAMCMPPSSVRFDAAQQCNRTAGDTVPVPDTGAAFLNGTEVQQLDCGRLDAYEYEVDCDLPATAGPWPGWAAGAALLLLVPLRTAWRAYQRDDEVGYLVAGGVSAVVPGLTAGLVVIVGALLSPFIALGILATGLAMPPIAGAIAVSRGASARTVATIVVSAMVLSLTAGVLATFQTVTMV